MKIPLELSFRGIDETKNLKDRVDEWMQDLEKVCDHIIRARIAIEKTQQFQDTGNPFRISINLTVPPGHELAVTKEPSRGDMHEPLEKVLHDAFEAGRKQLKELVEKQQGRIKAHPGKEVNGFIEKVFQDKGYGFLKSLGGAEVYFHRNSVLHNRFERLKPGTGVHFIEEMGEKGPQARSVKIIETISY